MGLFTGGSCYGSFGGRVRPFENTFHNFAEEETLELRGRVDQLYKMYLRETGCVGVQLCWQSLSF